MSHAHFWTKLKSSSISGHLFYFLAFSFFLIGCESVQPVRRATVPPAPEPNQRERPTELPLIDLAGSSEVPWQTWFPTPTGYEPLDRAESLLRQGKFIDAVSAYKVAEESSQISAYREEAFLRRQATLLRLGRSNVVLQDVASFAQARGSGMEGIDPRVGLIVAFAYEHSKNIDQAFAWFGLVYRKTGGIGEIAGRAKSEVIRLARVMPETRFQEATDRWSADALVGAALRQEAARRAQGKRPDADLSSAWFSASSDENFPGGSLPPAVTQATLPEGTFGIGLLLPFSGKFANYAENIRKGVDLAVAEYQGSLRIIVEYSDTQGDETVAPAEYDKLVSEKGVSVVLGPLLVKTTEAVAARSESVGIPIIAFTKKPGIPELGQTVFRLGATADDQAAELVNYASRSKNINSFATLYPNNENGIELAAAFAKKVREAGGRLVEQVNYNSGDPENLRAAFERVAVTKPGAIFLADSLENLQPVLLRTSDLQSSSPQSELLLLGPALWNDPVSLRGLGPSLEGAVFVSQFFTVSSNPSVTTFIDKYRAKYGAQPDLLAAQGYDVTKILLNQLNSQAVSPGEIIKHLSGAEPYSGVTGRLSVNDAGDILRRMSVLVVTRGEVVEIMAGGELTAGAGRSSISDEEEKTKSTPSETIEAGH